jgi:hypothetical protein
LSAADFVYFYALGMDGAMISIVSMVRRGSVVVSFLFGAMIFREKNLKSKVTVPAAKYTVFCKDGFVSVDGSLGTLYGPEVYVAPQTALIMGSY